jgi:hypothetical protein
MKALGREGREKQRKEGREEPRQKQGKEQRVADPQAPFERRKKY